MRKQYDIAICMPCFGRPERTRRAIESIMAQTVNNWEAFIIGDCCPDFENMMAENRSLGAGSWETIADQAGNKIHLFNLPEHKGGFGYFIRNYAIVNNRSKLLVFLDNDDIILPNHFERCIANMKEYGSPALLLQASYCKFNDRLRIPFVIGFGYIGHSEMVINCEAVRSSRAVIEQGPNYGHDWELIQNIIKACGSVVTVTQETVKPTYLVMGAGDLREKEVD